MARQSSVRLIRKSKSKLIQLTLATMASLSLAYPFKSATTTKIGHPLIIEIGKQTAKVCSLNVCDVDQTLLTITALVGSRKLE